jgi:hypothetical protein
LSSGVGGSGTARFFPVLPQVLYGLFGGGRLSKNRTVPELNRSGLILKKGKKSILNFVY